LAIGIETAARRAIHRQSVPIDRSDFGFYTGSISQSSNGGSTT
jgi:hypothetical protein